MAKRLRGSVSFLRTYFWHVIIAIIVVGGLANMLVWFGPWRRSQGEGVLELPSYPAELVARGREIFQANCAVCHGVDGDGYAHADFAAPALNGSMHAWHHSDSRITDIVRNGFGQMPAVGAGWTEDEVDAVLSYLKQWWDPEQLAYQTEVSRQNP